MTTELSLARHAARSHVKDTVSTAVAQLYAVLMILRAKMDDGGSLDVGEIAAIESVLGPMWHALNELEVP
jgi:hypothetical protein